MSTAISLLLALLGQLLPLVSSSGTVAKIITVLEGLIPLLIKEATDLVPMVQNIIAALQNNPATNAAQLVQLNALDAQCDAAFESAATDAEAEDAAASLTTPAT